MTRGFPLPDSLSGEVAAPGRDSRLPGRAPLVLGAAALLLAALVLALLRRRGGETPSPREVAPDVYVLAVLGTNVYFIRSGQSWVLVDTSFAWGGSGGRIRRAAEALFGQGARPEAILLTHIHPDHVGAALELARAWDRPVYVHPDELPVATADLDELERIGNPLDRRVLIPLMRMLPRERVESMRAQASIKDVARALDPAAPPPGLPDWTCIPAPGHSPGHLALFRERDRVLVAGDAVLAVDTNSPQGWLKMALRAGRPHLYGPPRYSNWDQRATAASIAALAALEPRVLATSHGAHMEGDAVARELRALAGRLSGAEEDRE